MATNLLEYAAFQMRAFSVVRVAPSCKPFSYESFHCCNMTCRQRREQMASGRKRSLLQWTIQDTSLVTQSNECWTLFTFQPLVSHRHHALGIESTVSLPRSMPCKADLFVSSSLLHDARPNPKRRLVIFYFLFFYFSFSDEGLA